MDTKPAMEAPLEDPVFLKIPPASLRTFKSYSDSLVHRGAHFASVVTQITFEPSRQFQLNFRVKQALKNEDAPLVLELLDDPQTQYLIGDIAPKMVRIGAQATAPRISAPAPAPASTITMTPSQSEAFEPEPAPAPKKRGRPAAKPAEEAPQIEPELVAEWEASDAALDVQLKSLMDQVGDMLK